MDLKIRLFALAKELGIDSKDLIEHCNSAGIKVKNSPLASISPEERDLVLGHLKKSGSTDATAPPEEAQMTPFARIGARRGRKNSQHQTGRVAPPARANGRRPRSKPSCLSNTRSRRPRWKRLRLLKKVSRKKRRQLPRPRTNRRLLPLRRLPLPLEVLCVAPERPPRNRRKVRPNRPALPPRSVRKNTFLPAACGTRLRSAR